MIQYKDFAPRQTAEAGFLSPAQYADFGEAAASAARWAENKGVRVINIETVVLPNMHDSYEEGTSDASLHTSGEMRSTWHQFVRVWYEEN